MIVRSADIRLVRVPLREPYLISRGALDAFVNVVLRLDLDDGTSGWGEAVPVSLTGNPAAYARLLRERLIPPLLGEELAGLAADPMERIAAIVDALLPLAAGNAAAVAAVDQALWDIAGKLARRSVGSLIGAEPGRRIRVDYTMGARPLDATASRAAEVLGQGYAGLVVKITCRDPEKDLQRVRIACETAARVRPDATIRVDANGGFDRDGARRFLDSLHGLPIAFVEQPVAAHDLDGMRKCRESGVAIAADESLNLPEDAEALVTAGACDVLNVKVTKAGGILQSLRVARIAEKAGLPLVIGGGLTYGISRFASRHIAAATPATRDICHQGPGPASQGLTGDITIPRPLPEDIAASGGHVIAPDAPGLGFAIDHAALAAFTVGENS